MNNMIDVVLRILPSKSMREVSESVFVMTSEVFSLMGKIRTDDYDDGVIKEKLIKFQSELSLLEQIDSELKELLSPKLPEVYAFIYSKYVDVYNALSDLIHVIDSHIRSYSFKKLKKRDMLRKERSIDNIIEKQDRYIDELKKYGHALAKVKEMMRKQLSRDVDEILEGLDNKPLGKHLTAIQEVCRSLINFASGEYSKEGVGNKIVEAEEAYDELYDLRIYPEIDREFLNEVVLVIDMALYVSMGRGGDKLDIKLVNLVLSKCNFMYKKYLK